MTNTLSSSIELLTLPKIVDDRGNLTFLEEESSIPFNIKRVYWIYDVPGGEVRGSHAFRTTREVLVVLSGSVDVELHDGVNSQIITLNRSYHGLCLQPMVWRTLANFSTNSLILVIASTDYHEEDYIREFSDFVQACKL